MEQIRRVLEYVTLGNAFCLLLSLVWLHTRFVNPKGKGSAVSCLPAALERAGVDPAQVHVLQIHIRRPPDDRGGGGKSNGNGSGNSGGEGASGRYGHRGGSGSERQRRKEAKASSSSSISSVSLPDGGSAGSSGQGGDVNFGQCGGSRVTLSLDTSSHADVAFAADEEEEEGSSVGAGAGEMFHGDGSGGAVCAEAPEEGGSGSGSGMSSGLHSEYLPPEVFYSMKRVTGRDAVGTLSGPGTLGIDGLGNGGNGEEGRRVDGGGGERGDCGSGVAVCGAGVEEKRFGVKTFVDAALSWGKRETGRKTGGRGGRGASAVLAGDGRGNRAERHGDGDEEFQRQQRPAEGGMQGTTGSREKWSWGWADADAEVAGDLQEGLLQQQLWEFHREAEAEGGGGGDKCGAEEEETGELVQDEVYLFSLEKSFLMLRPDLRQKHRIVTANVTVSSHDPCLGSTVIQALVKDFVGYDTVVMNWLISLYGGRGFLYGVHNNELFNLNYATEFLDSTEDLGKFLVFKIGVMFTTLFLFFTTTTLVSFTLRETQERMLKFTFLLQHHVRHRLPYAPLIFTHVVESLVFVPIMVGILFFLFEFFSDQLLAFMVLSVVWLCEVYSVVSVRTSMSIRFFPQVFFLYFTLFHVYFFSFPFGFSYLALVTTVLFLQHSMLFFWNTYEVPALRAGVVSALRPRQAGMVIGVVPRYDPQGMGLPMLPPPTPPPAQGRPRAATMGVEHLRLREQSNSAVQASARRPIPRSNSSPDPSSPSLGGPGRGGGYNRTAVHDAPVMAATAPRINDPRQTSGAVPAPIPILERITTPGGGGEWPLAREWGSGETNNVGGGGTGSSDGFGDYRRGNVSAPLLGVFPFSIWNLFQPSSSSSSRGHAGGDSRPGPWQHRDGDSASNAPAEGGFGVPTAGPGTGTGAGEREIEAELAAAPTVSGRGIEGGHPEFSTAAVELLTSAATANSPASEIVVSEVEGERAARPSPGDVAVAERRGDGSDGGGDSGSYAVEHLRDGCRSSEAAEEASSPRALVGDEFGRATGTIGGTRPEEYSQEIELLRRERLGLGGTQHRGMYDDG